MVIMGTIAINKSNIVSFQRNRIDLPPKRFQSWNKPFLINTATGLKAKE